MPNPHALPEDLRGIHDILSSHYLERLFALEERRKAAQSGRDRKGSASLARTIERMSAAESAPRRGTNNEITGYTMVGAALDGAEREYFEESAKLAGVPFDPQRVIVPWAYFARAARYPDMLAREMLLPTQRDLTAASAPAGGYLVNTETRDAIDTLRPWSVTARAGMTIEAGLQGSVVYPRTNTNVTGYWLGTEGAVPTESTPALGQIALTPKTAGAWVEFSRLLAKQANAERYVTRELLRTLGVLVDVAALVGTGASGQPTGLLNTTGIGSQSGTSLNIASIAALKGDAGGANAPDEAIAYLTTPAVRELLEARIATGSSRYVWGDDRVGSRPGYVSTAVPIATMICGAWSELMLGLWGPGFELGINPFDPAGFKAGIVQARILVTCDIAVAHAAAFSKADTIT